MPNKLITYSPKDLPRLQLPQGWKNLKVTLSFHGRAFKGYQYQPHVPSVQGALTQAWSVVCRDSSAKLMGCSRLDAGVSAYHYVLSVHTTSPLSCQDILCSLNGYFQSGCLADIRLSHVEEVDPFFHARFDALGKHYRYLLWYGHSQHALLGPRCWRIRSAIPLDTQKLIPLWTQFEGTHDFNAFRASDCTAKTTQRTIHKCVCWVHPFYSSLIIVDVWGEGFLKNMIRNMVGTCVDIALGRLPQKTILEAFHKGDRASVGQCAPGYGLSLVEVFYEMERFHLSLQTLPLAPF